MSPMRVIAWISIPLLVVAAGVVVLLLLFPSDVVTSRYATLTDARADQLFERGWLPDVLPPSSREIRVSNNLDHDTSEGGCRFDPAEFALLHAQLDPLQNPTHPFTTAFDDQVRRHLSAGEPAYRYEDEGSTWVFLCKPARGECTYDMWDDRFAGRPLFQGDGAARGR